MKNLIDTQVLYKMRQFFSEVRDIDPYRYRAAVGNTLAPPWQVPYPYCFAPRNSLLNEEKQISIHFKCENSNNEMPKEA